eukprot:10413597-Alexandrium_andersonii.AAC.1
MPSKELWDCLMGAGVSEGLAKWSATKGAIKIEAFADLAESRIEIAEAVGEPAGLGHAAAFACQPLETAGRNVEASVKAALSAKAKGEEMDMNYAGTPEKHISGL